MYPLEWNSGSIVKGIGENLAKTRITGNQSETEFIEKLIQI